jgi:hypothetical protein
MSRRPKASARDLAEKIIRRAKAANPGQELPYVFHLSEPPTPEERLQLAACRLLGWRVAIMPARCRTVDKWIDRYAPR